MAGREMSELMVQKMFFDFSSKIIKLSRALTLHYQFGFVQCHSYLGDKQLDQIRLLLESKDDDKKRRVLLEYEKRFARLVGSGFASSFASGRMAFYALMKTLGIGEGDEVILTAFTCSVMPNAVMRLGACPVYADIDRNTFGSGASAIQKVITGKTKLIVAQHSFGIPCDIDEIVNLAKERGIFVLEDCAIALDSSLEGVKVGNWGDAAIFSTDHSKPLNTIIGGMLYTRSPELQEKVEHLARMSPPLSDEHQQDLWRQMLFERKHYIPTRYPRAKIYSYVRKLWTRIVGTRSTVFLEDDYTPPSASKERYPYPAAMPPFLAMLGIFELERWSEQKARRKKLLSGFMDKLGQSSYSAYLPAVYNDPARNIVPLRFVFSCRGSGNLLRRMSRYIDVDWIWFRQPIICAVEGLESLQYVSTSCPVSEEIGLEIVNWPSNVIEGSEHELLRGVDYIVNLPKSHFGEKWL
jgi:dTDP-4-amino-4,6-dideoxygalactose transaminase